MAIKGEDLINWSKMSKVLAGGTVHIRRDKIPYKYRRRVNRLIKVCNAWLRVYGDE